MKWLVQIYPWQRLSHLVLLDLRYMRTRRRGHLWRRSI
jgi:hypothetical protein